VAEPEVDRDRHQHDDKRRDDHHARVPQYPMNRRSVDAEQHARDRMLLLRDHSPDEHGVRRGGEPSRFEVVALQLREHQAQRWIERDGEQRRDGHGKVLREGQRFEELPLLRFEGEDREERQRDHEQRIEARPPHLLNRGDQHFLVIAATSAAFPRLQLLVRVLDDDHCGIDERADGDGDPAERHDVRVDAEQAHGNEREDHRRGQREDRDHRARDVPEKQKDDERDDQHLDQKLVFQRVNRGGDQLRAVVRRHDLHAFRQ
jgi:hypothetical protein